MSFSNNANSNLRTENLRKKGSRELSRNQGLKKLKLVIEIWTGKNSFV